MQLALALLTLNLCSQSPADQGPVIRGQTTALTAQSWINNLTLRLPEDRSYVILFFQSPRPQTSDPAATDRSVERLEKAVADLNRLAADRKDVLVLGLTTDSQEQIAPLLSALKPRFAIGVRSIAYREFKIREFPTIVVLRQSPPAGAEPGAWLAQPISEFGQLADILGPAPDDSDAAEAPLEQLTNEELMDRLRSDPYSPAVLTTLEETLELLSFRMEPNAFLSFCDEIEFRQGYSSVWLGSVRYQRQLADPAVTQKQSDWSASKDVSGPMA